MGADRVERLPCLFQRVLLVRQDRQALGVHCAYIAKRAGVAFDRAALLVLRVRPCRKRFELAGLRTEVFEDRFGPFGELPSDLHDPLAAADAEQFDEGLFGLVVPRLSPPALTAKRADTACLTR